MESVDVGIAAAAIGFASGAWLRGLVFAHSVGYRQALRRRCRVCGAAVAQVAGGLLVAAPVDGRCPLCRSPVGPTPGGVELVGVAVLASLAWAASSGWVLAAWSWTALLGIALAFIDVAVLRLPDALTLVAGVGSLGLLSVAAVVTHSPGNVWQALAGGVGLGAVYAVAVLSRTVGMGRGDAMLAVVVGLNVGWLGLGALVTATLATAVIALLYTVAMLLAGRVRWTTHVPVGPFILLGALVAVLRHAD